MCSRATPTVISAMRRAASEWSGAQDEVIKTTKYYLMLSTNCSSTCRAIHWPPLVCFFERMHLGMLFCGRSTKRKQEKKNQHFKQCPENGFEHAFWRRTKILSEHHEGVCQKEAILPIWGTLSTMILQLLFVFKTGFHCLRCTSAVFKSHNKISHTSA